MNDKRYRIPVDFQEIERNALTALCVQDYRQPEDQIRFLVTREAQKRGLLPTNATNPVAEVSQAAATGFATPKS